MNPVLIVLLLILTIAAAASQFGKRGEDEHVIISRLIMVDALMGGALTGSTDKAIAEQKLAAFNLKRLTDAKQAKGEAIFKETIKRAEIKPVTKFTYTNSTSQPSLNGTGNATNSTLLSVPIIDQNRSSFWICFSFMKWIVVAIILIFLLSALFMLGRVEFVDPKLVIA